MPDLDRLISAIDAAEQSSYGSESDSDLQTDRATAIDFYNGRNIEPAPEGRSQIVDRTCFETIQWILPSLCRIFANGDDIVQFQPFGPEDEEGAKQESDYLNYLVTQKNPWFDTFLTWAQDALTLKNGYCMAYVEEQLKTELETYEKQSDEAVALLTQDEGVEVVEFSSEPDTQAPPQATAPQQAMPPPAPPPGPPMGPPPMDPAMGQMMAPGPPPPRMLHTLTIRRSKPVKKLCFKVLPPERTKIDIDTPSFRLDPCDYFEFWDIVTISHLRSLGFEIDDDIASGDEDTDETEESNARNMYSEETLDLHADHVDPSMRKVRIRMVWIRHDYDEDGIAELQCCFRVGSEILSRKGPKDKKASPAIYPCARVPVACFTPNLNTHRHIGTSEIDITADLQRSKTFVMRAGFDGLHLAINPRHIVSNEVNLDDLLVSRAGSVVRMLDNSAAIPGEGHVIPVVTQNTFPDAITGLEYLDQVRETRTGASRAMTGVDPSALGTSSSGVAINQLSTNASQRVEQIARIFASGIEYLFSVAHELLIKSGHQQEVVKLRGKWTTIDPSTWKTGRDMRIVVGYGAGNKDALVGRLQLLRQHQMEALQLGIPVATPQTLYENEIELTKAADFSAPQRFWVDPSTLPPPPPPQPPPEVLLEAEKIQSNERVKGAEIQSEERIKSAEIAQRDRETEIKAQVDLMLAQIKGGQTVDLERVRGAIKSNAERPAHEKIATLSQTHDKTKSELKGELEAAKGEIAQMLQTLAQQLQSQAEMLNAPREVIRGKDGRVAGVRMNGVERAVKRDANGRVSGLQ